MEAEQATPSPITPDALAKCLALTFPPSMVQLVQELVSPVPAFDTIAQIIQSDPVLSATVLTLVNSPYYALSTKVTELERAAVVLGTREILKIALSISFQQNTSAAIKRDKDTLFSDWRLSVWSSIAAEQIATLHSPKEAHLAYLGSLLKDLSLFLQLCLEQDTGDDTPNGNLCFLWLDEDQLSQERQRWGKTHAELTRSLLTEWNLPDAIMEGIEHHHDQMTLEEFSPLTQSIIIATRWAELQHAVPPDHGAIIRFEMQMRDQLRLNDSQLEALRGECTQRYESLLNLLGIQNASPDARFYTQSLQSMQSFYFNAMELANTHDALGVGKVICRQLRWYWGIESTQIALRNAEGSGFKLFSMISGDPVMTMTEAATRSKLPWKLKGDRLLLGPAPDYFGELRFVPSAKPLHNLSDMAVYSNFLSATLGAFYENQAKVVTKARTMQGLPIGVALVDAHGHMLDANSRFLSLTGQPTLQQGNDLPHAINQALGIDMLPLMEALRKAPDRRSASSLFCSHMVKQAANTACLYLSVHRSDQLSAHSYMVLLEDVTEISELEMQALRQRAFMEQLIASMEEFIATIDLQGNIVWAAPKSEHLIGSNMFNLTTPSGAYTGSWDNSFLASAVPAVPVEVVLTSPPPAEQTVQLELVFSPLRNAGDTPDTFLVVGRDLTIVRRLEDKIRQQAMFDGLTNLFNYSQFNAVLTREVERSNRTGRGMGLIFFDLDGFKKINDTYGHQTGDRLLKIIAKAILQSVRKGMDFPCRYGGDEFAVVVTEVDANTLELLGNRIHDAVRKHCQGSVALSMGIALLGKDETGEQLLQRVDRASYIAKQRGGNQSCWPE